EVGDGMAELDSILREPSHLVENLLRAAGAPGGEGEAAPVENVDGDPEALADDAEDVVRGHPERLVDELGLRRTTDSELADGALDAESRHVGANDERGGARDHRARARHLRLRKGGDDASAMAVTDPELASIEYPVSAVGRQARHRLHVLSVRADLGLGQGVG